jgi:hypothetical protein
VTKTGKEVMLRMKMVGEQGAKVGREVYTPDFVIFQK